MLSTPSIVGGVGGGASGSSTTRAGATRETGVTSRNPRSARAREVVEDALRGSGARVAGQRARRSGELVDPFAEVARHVRSGRERRRVAQGDERHARVTAGMRRPGRQPCGTFGELRHRVHQAECELDRLALEGRRPRDHVRVREHPIIKP